MPEKMCKYCGSPTTESEYFTTRKGLVWAHFECVKKVGKALLESGAVDEATAIRLPDGSR